jgi:hypothetical protein
MLEPLRTQFIVELAERFTSQGYEVLYLVANSRRGAEVDATGIKATVIHCGINQLNKLESELASIREERGNPLVISEVLKHTAESHGALRCTASWSPFVVIPRAVVTLDPVNCPKCGELAYISWCSNGLRLTFSCQTSSHGVWRQPAAQPVKKKAIDRGQMSNAKVDSPRKPWTVDQEATVLRLRAEGFTYKAVADRLGRSERSVEAFINRGGMAGTAARQKMRAALADIDF